MSNKPLTVIRSFCKEVVIALPNLVNKHEDQEASNKRVIDYFYRWAAVKYDPIPTVALSLQDINNYEDIIPAFEALMLFANYPDNLVKLTIDSITNSVQNRNLAEDIEEYTQTDKFKIALRHYEKFYNSSNSQSQNKPRAQEPEPDSGETEGDSE